MPPPRPAYTVEEPPEPCPPLSSLSSSQPDKPDFPEWATAWWEANVTSRMQSIADRDKLREQWRRRLQRRKAVEVEADYPRGLEARLRVQRDPPHPFFPHRRQEYEVGVDAAWLSAQGDGVTADFSAGSRAGSFTLLTATAALDPQRHTLGQATVQAGSWEPPCAKLEYGSRQHSLLLTREVEQNVAAAFDAADGAVQLSSTTSMRCLDNTLTLTAMAGSDLSRTDVGVEAAWQPPSAAAQAPFSGDGGRAVAAQGWRRGLMSAVVSLDGVGKRVSLEGTRCVAESGAKVDFSFESREEAGVLRLLRPECWSLRLDSPQFAGTRALCASLRGGGPDLAPSLSARLTPDGVDGDCGGLSLGASCGLGSGGAGPALEAEWRAGSEEAWVSSGTTSVALSAELRREFASSRANFDLLLTH